MVASSTMVADVDMDMSASAAAGTTEGGKIRPGVVEGHGRDKQDWWWLEESEGWAKERVNESKISVGVFELSFWRCM
jgi:hypothetical protein